MARERVPFTGCCHEVEQDLGALSLPSQDIGHTFWYREVNSVLFPMVTFNLIARELWAVACVLLVVVVDPAVNPPARHAHRCWVLEHWLQCGHVEFQLATSTLRHCLAAVRVEA